ncbi:MAG: hypothetical protein JNG89_18925 [Planctomycetaceae bacterium]|nr:hypothetical protein [Planctomycetaceae bacterium]
MTTTRNPPATVPRPRPRQMAERKNTHGLTVKRHRRATVIDIGEMEIWDGADLSLIRDTLNRLIIKERRRSIAIQMRTVKYVPSGFFGMLYDWFERGIAVRLVAPQDRVTQMLWFQRFFELEQEDCYVLRECLNQNYEEMEEAEQETDQDWDIDRPAPLSPARA